MQKLLILMGCLMVSGSSFAATSKFKSLLNCIDAIDHNYVNLYSRRSFYRTWHGNEDFILLEGNKIGSTGVFAFNENGAYFHKYAKSSRPLKDDYGKTVGYGRCLKLSLPSGPKGELKTSYHDLSWSSDAKTKSTEGVIISSGSSDCGFAEKQDESIVDQANMRDDQNEEYYNVLANNLAAQLQTIETNPHNLAPVTKTGYQTLLKSGFSECTNTGFPELNAAAKSALTQMATVFPKKSAGQSGESESPPQKAR